jgi:hypothetical protein
LQVLERKTNQKDVSLEFGGRGSPKKLEKEVEVSVDVTRNEIISLEGSTEFGIGTF